MLLLTTTGAKSGLSRTTPLVYTTDGDQIVVIASKAGAPTNPDWYHNLVANPEVTLEVGEETFPARASVPKREERDRIFAGVVAKMPGFGEYQQNTDRLIPVVLLERLAGSTAAASAAAPAQPSPTRAPAARARPASRRPPRARRR